MAAIRLTLLVAAICVPLNTVCGIAAARSIAKFDSPGKRLVMLLIEWPLTVSPIVSGLVWVLLFGANGWFGPAPRNAGVQIVVAPPGIVQEQGREQEEAAALLGAGFWGSFRRVTLPDIRWALLAGILLCNARAMGEIGAVAVVSGHNPGQTETMPLHIETLYNGYQSAAAFTMAALLALVRLLTLALKALLEWRIGREAGAPA